MKTAARLTRAWIATGLIVASASFAITGQQAPTPTSDARRARVEWLQQHSIPVRSTDPADEAFADLEPLRAAIGNSRIVMLGEQSHGDGTVFLAKTRLIRYLHERLGFEVLAFESGLYDVRKSDEFLRQGEDGLTAVRRGVFGIWTRSEQVLPLLDYIGARARSKNPLVVAGFDSQLTSTASREFWVSDLLAFLAAHKVATPDDWQTARPLLEALIAGKYFETAPSPEDQQKLLTVLDRLAASAKALPAADRDVLFWQQNLRSIRAHAIYTFARNRDSKAFKASDNNGRDAQMGENLVWLANTYYPGKRIIVWAATFHNMRNPTTVGESNVYAGLSTMGHIAWQTLGSQIYNLGFTASEGRVGPWMRDEKRDVPVPDPDSLEGLFASTTHNVAVVNFRQLPESGKWLKSPIVAMPLGYSPMKADWTQVLDGMMYTRVMQPSTKASR